MKLNNAAICGDCDEVFEFNHTGCPSCGNRYIAMVNLFFNQRQAYKHKDRLEKTSQRASPEAGFS